MSQHLKQEVHRRIYRYLKKRPPPQLERQADGSYFWDGHAITATIAPTGRVNFENRSAIEFDGFLLPPQPKEPPRWLDEQFIKGKLVKGVSPLRFRFGLTDMLARAAGDEPYTAERAWFMEQTRALRDRLAKTTERDGT